MYLDVPCRFKSHKSQFTLNKLALSSSARGPSVEVKPTAAILHYHSVRSSHWKTLIFFFSWRFHIILCPYNKKTPPCVTRSHTTKSEISATCTFHQYECDFICVRYISERHTKMCLYRVVRIIDDEMKSMPIGTKFAA